MVGRFWKNDAQRIGYPEGINGTIEIAFDFPAFSDVDKVFEGLVKACAKPVMRPTAQPWGQRICYISDSNPGANLIEIVSFGKQSKNICGEQ